MRTTTIHRFMLKSILVFLVTGCLNPVKVKETIEYGEYQARFEKYNKVLNSVYDSKLSGLKLDYLLGKTDKETILRLSCNKSGDRREWLVHLQKFQEKLSDLKLDYYVIELSLQKAAPFLYQKNNVKAYEKAFELFRKNLNQIENKQYSQLVQSMPENTRQKSIEDLFGFVSVSSKSEQELFNYANYYSDLSYVMDDVAVTFKVRTNMNSWLYFNYRVHKDLSLESIDLSRK